MAGVCLLGVVACSGGSRSLLPPLAAGNRIGGAQSLTTASTPNLTGTIAAVSGTTINVNGGTGCGYVNVTYGSTTQINYNGHTLSAGTPISVWGSGSCATSFTATTLSLGTLIVATPAPSSTSAPAVAGAISSVSSPTQFTIQGGPGCGYVNVNYTSSTQVALNGYTLKAGTYANVWGSGSCATSFTASSISLGTTIASSPSSTPTPASTSTPTPVSTSAPAVAGTIYATNGATQLTIQGGAGCGYVNVNYGSSTQISLNGYTMSSGTYAKVWGSGNCATSFSATAISLGTGTATSATPAPATTPTPTPTTTGAPAVAGTIYATNGATQFTIQGGAGCGYVNVTYSGSTSIASNGYTLNAGTYAKVWGSGSCATSFTASSISLGTGTTSSATPAPAPATSTPAPAPTPAPTFAASGYTDSAYAQIANPGAWPSNFRPYCANASANASSPCPWNDTLPDNPQQLYPSSASIVSAIFAGAGLALPADWSLGGDYDHPTYVASSSDPIVNVTCTTYCGVASASIHIPSAARAAGYFAQSSSLDGHMAIIEPDGTEYDMYHALSYSGQASVSVGGLYKTSVLGSGQMPGGGATSGAALAAGIIRADELARGVIPHALFASTNCVSGSYVYPGGAQAYACASGVGPPLGARLQLTLTDSQINALGLPVWEAAILHAMHDYGVYILDTQGGSSPGGLYFRFESQTQYAAYSKAYPYASMSLNIGGFDSALNWAQSFRIVAGCYAQETCTH